MLLNTPASAAFAVRCDRCGRPAEVVFVDRRADARARGRGLLAAIDAAIGCGFTVWVTLDEQRVSVSRSLCASCATAEGPS